jgi:hypothetical protein
LRFVYPGAIKALTAHYPMLDLEPRRHGLPKDMCAGLVAGSDPHSLHVRNRYVSLGWICGSLLRYSGIGIKLTAVDLLQTD